MALEPIVAVDGSLETLEACERQFGRGMAIAVSAFAAFFVDTEWGPVDGSEAWVVYPALIVAAAIGLLLMGAANARRNESHRIAESTRRKRSDFD